MTLSYSGPTNLYYRHSGKFSVTGIVMALTAGAITAVVAAFAYSYLVLYVPFIYLNLLATIGFGFIMGAATAWAAKLGKIRSASLTFLLALIVTVIGFWLAWAVWVNGVVDRYYTDADLETLPPQADPLISWSVQTEICPTCQNLNALTVYSHITTVKKGETTNVNKPVVKRMLLSNDELIYVTTMMALRQAPPPLPPPPMPEGVDGDPNSP